MLCYIWLVPCLDHQRNETNLVTVFLTVSLRACLWFAGSIAMGDEQTLN